MIRARDEKSRDSFFSSYLITRPSLLKASSTTYDLTRLFVETSPGHRLIILSHFNSPASIRVIGYDPLATIISKPQSNATKASEILEFDYSWERHQKIIFVDVSWTTEGGNVLGFDVDILKSQCHRRSLACFETLYWDLVLRLRKTWKGSEGTRSELLGRLCVY